MTGGQLQFDTLQDADLGAAMGLSVEAGWNQTPADWRRLLALAPGRCLAGRRDGRLVATATAVTYDPGVSWIGMVLVTAGERGRGTGTAILGRAVERARAGGAGVVGLDATDLGRRIYLPLGFSDVAPIDRWAGRLQALAPPARGLAPLDPQALDEALAFDRAACGVDRGALLAHLAAEPGVTSWIVREADRPAGFAFLRPGREHPHLGPIVCAGTDALAALLGAAARAAGERSLLVDVVRDAAIAPLLAQSGLGVQRRLTRMTSPAARGILVGAAATSFEWG